MDGFFTELCIDLPGQAFSLKVKEELYHQKSAYQDVKVIERYFVQHIIIALLVIIIIIYFAVKLMVKC